MEHEQSRVEKFKKFTWKVENFSRLKTNEVRSKPFILGGYPWRILLFPKGNNDAKHLSIYLEAVKTANMSEGWQREVKLKLVVFNQVDEKMTIIKESKNEFNASQENDLGFKSFMTLSELHDPDKGFIVNDTCIIGTQVFICKLTHEKPISQAPCLMLGCQTSHVKLEIPSPEPDNTNLQTCSPLSFVPSEQANAELVYAALGKLIYFLKTRKVKDMNEQASKELQFLWDELAKFKIDLTWLEPQVQSALGIKSYVEKALEVEKLTEDVVVQELKTEMLQATLADAKVSLDIERDLLKAKGLKERDLDSELGSGSWRPRTLKSRLGDVDF
ncbi:MATH domain and coiled-coil domain-containing protein At3g58250-like [Vicia villosa]|uniref:MATH domain and coiled-coil domain-containing protein At3g58250-like n=1 Tax=Vicia villosa TaxID=3911 RepID=UPI00273A9758|nr:MATH domain and coiled-coil domain-containing protein At3g58250-like [Vicia villosa]